MESGYRHHPAEDDERGRFWDNIDILHKSNNTLLCVLSDWDNKEGNGKGSHTKSDQLLVIYIVIIFIIVVLF